MTQLSERLGGSVDPQFRLREIAGKQTQQEEDECT